MIWNQHIMKGSKVYELLCSVCTEAFCGTVIICVILCCLSCVCLLLLLFVVSDSYLLFCAQYVIFSKNI